MVKGTTNFTVCEKKTAVLYLNGAKLKENTVGARHLHVLTETGCGRLAAVFHSYLCCFLRDLLAICVIPLLPVPQLRGHWLRSFFCRARCIGPILSLVDRGGFRTWLTGEQLHRSAQSLFILEDNNRPAFAAGKPAQTERGHVHSGVVVLHLTFGRARWVTRNHLQPVYSPALLLPPDALQRGQH